MAARDTHRGATLLLALLAALLLCYHPALRAGYIWDDDVYVTGNETLRSPAGLRSIWMQPQSTPQYYPLVFTSFWVEHRLWGLHPLGYHLVNVLLHAANALLVWRLLRRLRLPGAALAAALFALHPVHVESVAWITERKNVLSGLFYLGSMLAYLRFSPPEPGESVPTGRWRWYALALLLFLAALLSKTVTCTLPAAIVLLLWWKRGTVSRRDLLALVPFFALGLAMGLNTVWIEKHHVGAEGVEWSLSWLERFLIAGRALWFYASKIILPVDLIFIYPRWSIRTQSAWQYLYPLAAMGTVILLWLARGRFGRGPVAAALFFIGTLAPALGFLDVYPMRFSFVADHFQYLASLGLIALAAAAATHLTSRWGAGARASLACGVLLILGALTWNQAREYEDARTLWTTTLQSNPDSWIAHNNLGLILYQEGNMAAAREHYSRALEIHPRYAEAQYNMGLVLSHQGELARAQEHLSAAAALRPDYPDTHLNLGVVLARQGKLAEARDRFAEAVRLRPDYPDAHLNLGVVLGQQGKPAESVAHLNEALRLDPRSERAHYNLGLALAQLGDLERAAGHFASAARIDPSFAEAHKELGWIRAQQADWSAASRSFRNAVAARQASAEFRYLVGVALRREGKEGEAAAQLVEAKRVDPSWPAAASRVAWLLATHADPRVREGEVALRLAREASESTGHQVPAFLDTLAAAQAETGDYGAAVSTARQALDRATAQGQWDLAEQIRPRLRLYESRQPFRERMVQAPD